MYGIPVAVRRVPHVPDYSDAYIRGMGWDKTYPNFTAI